MYAQTIDVPSLAGQGHLGTARVVAVREDHHRVRVSLDDDSADLVWATPAVPNAGRLQPGTEVLVVGATEDRLFVIGVVGGAQAGEETVELEGGSRAVSDRDRRRLQVYSEREELLFEYDERARKTRVRVPDGDLELVTPRGDIRLVSSGAIRMTSASDVSVTTPQMTIHAAESRFIGNSLWTQWRSVHVKAGTLNAVVDTVIEKAKNVFRTITDLCQLRAGRMHSVVEGGLHAKAKHVDLTAEQNVRIDGKEIHLG